ncbi:bifunctional protein FolC subfamily protein [Besnoitia besnoiti]|uniref:Bifunctional protein FolC subfamily protein n=1 Tax=Besnoitia besnoiti TaxID=94643 RepID=A0A2A9MMG4_BESBE|nr:bifunctional protein FolC subfamily protein [Besnoitia besnoiti]PFH37296.1 bifunctional protein FolC subfamily protein [Besnoitia besnoiti]
MAAAVGEAAAAASVGLVRSYKACLRQLFRHHGMRLGTDRVKAVATSLGNPQDDFDVIHVAGTNGKGTTCAKIAACLSLKGYKVGTYTSPHILCLRERIRVDNQMIPEDSVVALYNRVVQTASHMNVSLSFFEILTHIAFLYFAQEEVDWAVVETGLGGRYDATNIISVPRCTVITSIGWDHMNILGKTLDKIAQEKSGIIKPKVPVVLGPSAAVHQCFWRRASSLGSEVVEVAAEPRGEDFEDENIRICRAVVEKVLHLDLLPNQLESALAIQLPLRAHVLSRLDLQLASELCGVPPRSRPGSLELPGRGSASSVNAKRRDSQNGAKSASGATETSRSDLRDHALFDTPHAVVVDLAHNESAIERFLQFASHHYFGIPVRLVVSLSKERDATVLQPIINYLSFSKNNRLVRVHFVEADHERAKRAVSLLEELETSDAITAALRTQLLAGLEEQHRALSEGSDNQREINASSSADDGALTKTLEQLQKQEERQRKLEERAAALKDIPEVIRPHAHLLETCGPGNLPDVLRFAYRQATAEQSVLLVCGTFFMMREVVSCLGFLHGPTDDIDMNEQFPPHAAAPVDVSAAAAPSDAVAPPPA